MKYVIHWESNRTGSTGHGAKRFDSRKEAQKICDSLNGQYENVLYHWIEIDREGTV